MFPRNANAAVQLQGFTSDPSDRLVTSTSACEVLVIRAPDTDESLTCAGGQMIDNGTAGAPTGGELATQLGKRYADDQSGLEVLWVKPGVGPLRLGKWDLVMRAPKLLPASD